MSDYLRRNLRLSDRGRLVLYIFAHLGFPYLLIDRHREHFGVSGSFD
jgi:hypothetical protein